MATYTKEELETIISTLKTAYQRAVESGGVTSYTINSGQGSTSVTQASLSTIRGELEYYTNLLNELNMYENGEHITALRGLV